MSAASAQSRVAESGAGIVLLTLAAGQFLMTLDTSVMNVAIATVAEDVGTTVTGIQTAITLYTLVMAMLMITGGKIGAIVGRRRAFTIGCVIYGVGSFTTAIAPTLPVLIFGWSFLEGVGAALILPAIVALVATNFPVVERPRAYGLVAAAGAIAVAVGPLIGGFATTYFSWRYVFLGEVFVVLGILVLARRIHDEAPARRPRMDWLGVFLSAAGLGLSVFGVLKSGEWGWVTPTLGGPTLLGTSPVLWLLIGGLFLIWLFLVWEERLEARGAEPLVPPSIFEHRQLTTGLTLFSFQYFIQAGVFFVVPLFLSVALGLSALATGRAAPSAVDHPVAGGGRHPTILSESEPSPCSTAGSARDAGGHRRADRRAGSRRLGRDRRRADAIHGSRRRGTGLAARRRHRVGCARRAELGSGRAAEHGHEPGGVARDRARRVGADRGSHVNVPGSHPGESGGAARGERAGERAVGRWGAIHVRCRPVGGTGGGGRARRDGPGDPRCERSGPTHGSARSAGGDRPRGAARPLLYPPPSDRAARRASHCITVIRDAGPGGV